MNRGLRTATTPYANFPDCVLPALNQMCKVIRAAVPMRGNRSNAGGKNPDLQVQIDNEVFCVTASGTGGEKRCRLNALQQFALLDILAKFFIERADDTFKYSYFEALFLGREGEGQAHAHRIEMLFKLASYVLQYPVFHFYNHISQWLSKVTNKPYADELIAMLVEDFIVPSTETNPTHKFLLPLEAHCPEFTAFFVNLAPKHAPTITPALTNVVGSYLTRNYQFIIRHVRDSPNMAQNFSEEIFPRLLKFDIAPENASGHAELHAGLMLTLECWARIMAKQDKHSLDLKCLFTDKTPWTIRRYSAICIAVKMQCITRKAAEEKLKSITIPAAYANHFEKSIQLTVRAN